MGNAEYMGSCLQLRLPGAPHQVNVQVDGRLVSMASRYSRTSSDTLKLRRLITSLKTSGSDLAIKLEDQSAQIFSGVQIVRSNDPCIPKQANFDSDNEEETSEFLGHADYIRKQKVQQEAKKGDEAEKEEA